MMGVVIANSRTSFTGRSLVFLELAWEPFSSLDLSQASLPAPTVGTKASCSAFLLVLKPASPPPRPPLSLSLLSSKRQFKKRPSRAHK